MKIKYGKIRQLTMLLAILLVLFLPVSAFAEDGDEERSDWETQLLLMLSSHGADPSSVTAGYYNLVTGEEHFWNPDEYRISGSMYKVPLNMLMLDWINEGIIDGGESVYGYRYQDLLEGTVIYSNNDDARTLWTYIGDNHPELPGTVYHRYRILIAPYMGEDPDAVDEKYYENNFFTARQMLTCMKTLYEGGEKYERLIEAMKKAEPDKYFRLKENRFEIAHKYGWFVDSDAPSILYMNDCAICYTADPIAIVLFTSGTEEPYGVLADFCTLMCDYATEQYELRLALEKAEAAALEEAKERDRLLQEAAAEETETAETTEAPLISPISQPQKERIRLGPILALVMGVVTLLLCFAALTHRNREGLRMFYAVLTLVTAAGILVLCFLGYSLRFQYLALPETDPGETVTAFFEALKAGNYDDADVCLLPGTSLGLQNTPADPNRAAILRALEESWDYRLLGESSTERGRAWQRVQLQSLRFSRMDTDLRRQFRQELLELSGILPREELYDGNGDYLPAIVTEAWEKSMVRLLEHGSDYWDTRGLQLELRLTEEGWRIVPDQTLLSALSGE